MRKEVIGNATLYLGDCRDAMSALMDNSVDAIVCDPPYGLSFMGNRWDYDVPSVEIWTECLRVLKPGGHLLAFAGTRTQHRMAVRIEDAGFEIRDMIAWVYGAGFPKSLDVSKAIDKAAGAERSVVGRVVYGDGHVQNSSESIGYGGSDPAADSRMLTAPATDAARQWEGWGTGLKPALEPITVARKPLVGTVAANVLAHGTGALNIDGCRVATDMPRPAREGDRRLENNTYAAGLGGSRAVEDTMIGRWPANLIHDGSEEVLAPFPNTASGAFNQANRKAGNRIYGTFTKYSNPKEYGSNSGSAARFFYCAKASKADRGDNSHPTVKPTDLMRYLCRLVTPPGGLVLDPFMGSGSTGKAAILEGFRFAGIEREPKYFDIACRRIEDAQRQGRLIA